MNNSYGIKNINFLKPYSSELDSVVSSPQLSISGRILAYDGIFPISDATITFIDHIGISDANGLYIIVGIPIGLSGLLTCIHPDHQFADKSIPPMFEDLNMTFEEV